MPLSGQYRLENNMKGRAATATPIDSPDRVPEIVDTSALQYFTDPMAVDPDQNLADIERGQLTGDPEQESVDIEIDPEQLESVILKDCQDAYDSAVSLSQNFKEKWQMYRDMAQNKPPIDDANDPLIKLGYWVGLLARFKDVMLAIIGSNTIPDPSAYDFFEIVKKEEWYGLDGFGEAVTNILRDKFKQMAPQTANGFLDVYNDLLIDLIMCGNECALVTHEVLNDFDASDNGDGLIEGPAVRYLDIMNVWPERLDVGSMAETGVNVYEPVSPDEIWNMGFKNLDKIIKENPPEILRNIDENAFMLRAYVYNPTQDKVEQTMEGYKRIVRFVRFPYYNVRKGLGLKDEDYTPEIVAEINKIIVEILAEKFEFDPSKVNDGTWWDIEWIGQSIAQCRPYPLALPVGKGPVAHSKFFPRPGWLWGDGLWDRCQVDERFYNMIRRAIIKITMFASDPPYEVWEQWLDPEFTEMFGSQPRLEPGMIIKRTNGDQKEQAFKPIEMNERALDLLRNEISGIYGEMRVETGVTEQLEGTSTDSLATVNANNMQQSMTVVSWHIKRIENGLLKELVQRMYVVMWQAMKILGVPQTVSISDTEAGLSMLEIKPEDILGLSMIDIRMTGSTAPANKQAQLQSIEKLVGSPLFQMGILDPIEITKAWINMMGLSGGDRFINQQDPMQMMQAANHIQAALGPNAVQNPVFNKWMNNPAMAQALQMQQGMMGAGGQQQMGNNPVGPQNGMPNQPPMSQNAPIPG